DLGMVNLLIRYGAYVNAALGDGRTALFFSYDGFVNKVALARLLIEHGADMNAKNSNGDTCLHDAAMMSSAGIVELLLDKGANRCIKNNQGKTPFDLGKYNPAIVKLFRENIAKIFQ